ncbi:MAG: arginine--tRNA ligase, partial [Lachnospiraceae bacterium]|nr:arginine--tRNA ligase [Lachnospiraceae bacterium]
MREILDLISEELQEACKRAGIDPKYGTVTPSNRPDLCEYQCNGAMAAAKELHKAPFEIADQIVAECQESENISSIEVVKPGFINIKLNNKFISDLLNQMLEDSDHLGV